MIITFSRIRELARGAEPEDGEAQEIARSLVDIVYSIPEPLGYLWRWKIFAEGSSPGWNYSSSPLKHPDVECTYIFHFPQTEKMEQIRTEWESQKTEKSKD